MTRTDKDFIQAHINYPWAVQQLCIAESPDASEHSFSNLPFRNIDEVLGFGDIPFFESINDDIAFAFLPLNSPQILQDLNQLLIEQSGYYIASIALPGVNLKCMGNIQSDINLHIAFNRFRSMVRNIQTHISFQLEPQFSQSRLDDILTELKDKTFAELSPLKQAHLKHFSVYLNKHSKNSR